MYWTSSIPRAGRLERLSPVDAANVRVESHSRPIHVAGVAVIEGTALLDAAGRLRLAEARRCEAVTLGATAVPRLGPAGRALILSDIPAVGLTGIYVGAHLPLDTAGGATLGLAVDAALALAQGRASVPCAQAPTMRDMADAPAGE